MRPTVERSDAPGVAPVRRIAVEEAFATPELLDAWRASMRGGVLRDPAFESFYSTLLDAPSATRLRQALVDVGPGRIAEMDAAGIDVQVLSVTSPGVQVLGEDDAVEHAHRLNAQLAEWIAHSGGRYAGLAAVAPQAPKRAAREIEDAVTRLGMCGVIVNSSTGDRHLDDPVFAPMLEAAEATSAPIYLHPATPPPSMAGPFLDYGLSGPIWGFAAESALHAVRMILGGVFERHPRLRVVLGHLGEGVPFWLPRMDAKYGMYRDVLALASARALAESPSECFSRCFSVTTSGMPWPDLIRFTIDRLGIESVLFAADYPYEANAPAVAAIERADLSDAERRQVFAGNAERVFGLDPKPLGTSHTGTVGEPQGATA